MFKGLKKWLKGSDTFEIAAILFIILGIIVIVLSFVAGSYNKIIFTGASGNLLDLSEFVGGLIGSFWSLAGVLLFYASLTSQREDLEAQKDLLVKQIDEVVAQTKEFRIQNEINKQQQDEETFFQLLRFHNEIISSIEIDVNEVDFATGEKITKTIVGRKSFVEYYDIFKRFFQEASELNTDQSADGMSKVFDKAYNSFYLEYQADLGHYFRNLQNVILFIDTLKEDSKEFYLSLLLAQLSNFELTLLFFHCLRKTNEEFKEMVVKYRILAQVPKDEITAVGYKLYDAYAFGDDGFGSGDILDEDDMSFGDMDFSGGQVEDITAPDVSKSKLGSLDDIMSKLKSITDKDLVNDDSVSEDDYADFFQKDVEIKEVDLLSNEIVERSKNEDSGLDINKMPSLSELEGDDNDTSLVDKISKLAENPDFKEEDENYEIDNTSSIDRSLFDDEEDSDTNDESFGLSDLMGDDEDLDNSEDLSKDDSSIGLDDIISVEEDLDTNDESFGLSDLMGDDEDLDNSEDSTKDDSSIGFDDLIPDEGDGVEFEDLFDDEDEEESKDDKKIDFGSIKDKISELKTVEDHESVEEKIEEEHKINDDYEALKRKLDDGLDSKNSMLFDKDSDLPEEKRIKENPFSDITEYDGKNEIENLSFNDLKSKLDGDVPDDEIFGTGNTVESPVQISDRLETDDNDIDFESLKESVEIDDNEEEFSLDSEPFDIEETESTEAGDLDPDEDLSDIDLNTEESDLESNTDEEEFSLDSEPFNLEEIDSIEESDLEMKSDSNKIDLNTEEELNDLNNDKVNNYSEDLVESDDKEKQQKEVKAGGKKIRIKSKNKSQKKPPSGTGFLSKL